MPQGTLFSNPLRREWGRGEKISLRKKGKKISSQYENICTFVFVFLCVFFKRFSSFFFSFFFLIKMKLLYITLKLSLVGQRFGIVVQHRRIYLVFTRHVPTPSVSWIIKFKTFKIKRTWDNWQKGFRRIYLNADFEQQSLEISHTNTHTHAHTHEKTHTHTNTHTHSHKHTHTMVLWSL